MSTVCFSCFISDSNKLFYTSRLGKTVALDKLCFVGKGAETTFWIVNIANPYLSPIAMSIFTSL